MRTIKHVLHQLMQIMETNRSRSHKKRGVNRAEEREGDRPTYFNYFSVCIYINIKWILCGCLYCYCCCCHRSGVRFVLFTFLLVVSNGLAAKKFVINVINRSVFLHEFEHIRMYTLILLHRLSGNS